MNCVQKLNYYRQWPKNTLIHTYCSENEHNLIINI